MPLEPIDRLMQGCKADGYAIGYFESWNLESLQGVVDAAEQTRSPVILGFNGEFLSHEGRRAAERLVVYGKLGLAVAESSTAPCGLIFNECPNDQWVMNAADAGFNLVMPADPRAGFDDYMRRVRQITQYAHARGVAVEAELGELPCGVSEHGGGDGELTDPDAAKRFVQETGVDLLAVSVGNVHIQIDGQQELNLDHLATLQQSLAIPLVLHGGSGVRADSLRAAIAGGVRKVNYGTYIKQRCIAALRKALAVDDPNPHHLLGFGGDRDLGMIVRHTVRDAVVERIELLGCCGKA
jgi:ketose-bisphosphate aldolase